MKGWIGDIVFVKQVDLQPSSTLEVDFSPADFPQLQRRSMRLWWPNGYGEPYLYDAGFEVRDVATGQRSSSLTYKAGIREMSYRDLDSETKLYATASASRHWAATGASQRLTSTTAVANTTPPCATVAR